VITLARRRWTARREKTEALGRGVRVVELFSIITALHIAISFAVLPVVIAGNKVHVHHLVFFRQKIAELFFVARINRFTADVSTSDCGAIVPLRYSTCWCAYRITCNVNKWSCRWRTQSFSGWGQRRGCSNGANSRSTCICRVHWGANARDDSMFRDRRALLGLQGTPGAPATTRSGVGHRNREMENERTEDGEQWTFILVSRKVLDLQRQKKQNE
jgi:hypothetical protein